jgi:hypothetical protein
MSTKNEIDGILNELNDVLLLPTTNEKDIIFLYAAYLRVCTPSSNLDIDDRLVKRYGWKGFTKIQLDALYLNSASIFS